MAYDPEARASSNTAMVIGIVALVVVVLGALAYWATRPSDTPTVVTAPGTTTIVHDNTPAPGAPPVIVQQPVPVPGTTIVKTVPGAPAKAPATTTTRTDVHVTVPAPSSGVKTAPASGAPNVTINNNNRPAAGSSSTSAPPAGDGATTTTTNSTTSSDGAAPTGLPKY